MIRAKTYLKKDIADKVQGQAGQVLIPGCEELSTWSPPVELTVIGSVHICKSVTRPSTRALATETKVRHARRETVMGQQNNTITAVEKG